MTFTQDYLAEVEAIAKRLDPVAIDKLANLLASVRAAGGRLFILGVGGSAANASHAVNDFRKIAGLEAYAPSDNAAELTARTNDEGWETVFEGWLRVSRLGPRDMLLVLSVGGGSPDRNISVNLVRAIDHAKSVRASVAGIVGRDDGYTARFADVCVIVPCVNPERLTPHSEAFQSIIWHLLVWHPALKPLPASGPG